MFKYLSIIYLATLLIFLSNCSTVKNKQLHIGMHQNEVKNILGTYDYSPIDGLYYYSSHDKKTLRIDYRDKQGHTTSTVHSIILEEIGE